MLQLDDFDRRILAALQRDGRITNVALAEEVALSPSQCARRLQRLEEAGAIRGYGAFLDPADVNEVRMISRHGSLTPAEMWVPLLVART